MLQKEGPTFRLAPLDSILEEERNSWIQVWTKADTQSDGWLYMLKRPFYGLKEEFYSQSFEREIDDLFLKEIAIRSLKNASNEQQYLYDLSFRILILKKKFQ